VVKVLPFGDPSLVSGLRDEISKVRFYWKWLILERKEACLAARSTLSLPVIFIDRSGHPEKDNSGGVGGERRRENLNVFE